MTRPRSSSGTKSWTIRRAIRIDCEMQTDWQVTATVTTQRRCAQAIVLGSSHDAGTEADHGDAPIRGTERRRIAPRSAPAPEADMMVPRACAPAWPGRPRT